MRTLGGTLSRAYNFALPAGPGDGGGPSLDVPWRDADLMLPLRDTKALFGYYHTSGGDPVEQEAQFGRPFDFSTYYLNGPTPGKVASMQSRCNEVIGRGTMMRVTVDLTKWRDYDVRLSNHWARVAAGDFDADFTSPTGTALAGVDSVLQAVMRLDHRVWLGVYHEADLISEGGGHQTSLASGVSAGASTITTLVKLAGVGDTYTINDAGKVETVTIASKSGTTSTLTSPLAFAHSAGVKVETRAGTAPEFRAAYQHIHARALALKAADPTLTLPVFYWVMAFNPTGPMPWGTALTDTGSDGMYPGHQYVDIVGWDPYNWANVAGHGSQWQNPTTMFRAGMDWWESRFLRGGKATLAAVTASEGVYKPVMIGESGTNERWSSVTYTGNPGDARQWLNELVTYLAPGGRGNGAIKAYMYFGVDYYAGEYPNDGSLMGAPDWSIRPVHAQKWPGLADLGAASLFQADVP